MKKALIIGIDNYPYNKLYGCINDANAIANLLERNENCEKNFEIKLKKDIPTKRELKKVIFQLFNADCEICLMYFSGHGYLDTFGNGYLVTPDTRQFDEGVPLDYILQCANQSKAQNRIVILDCCHSGAMGIPTIPSSNLVQISEGVTIMTSSRKTENAFEIDGHGVFTALVIEALSGGAADTTGVITLSSIYSYVDKALGAWEQRPVFKTNVTSFVCLRTINVEVPITTIRNLCKYFIESNDEYLLNSSYEYTNSKDYKMQYKKPVANFENVTIFQELQQLHSLGLVVPIGEKYMYWAAMNGKSCKLTVKGKYFWNLIKNGKL